MKEIEEIFLLGYLTGKITKDYRINDKNKVLLDYLQKLLNMRRYHKSRTTNFKTTEINGSVTSKTTSNKGVNYLYYNKNDTNLFKVLKEKYNEKYPEIKIMIEKLRKKDYCEHNIDKYTCKKCSNKSLCVHCQLFYGKKKYIKSLDKEIRCCVDCFYNFYPNDKIPRRYKRKQHYFNEKLIEEFGNIFRYDKEIICGCSKKRPDWFLDCFTHSIIIELDEEQHRYNSCDEKRMMELFKDLGSRNLVLIRINPDKYKNEKEKIKGCFTFDNKNNIKCDEDEFNKRFNLLVDQINYYRKNKLDKEIIIEKLFFDVIRI